MIDEDTGSRLPLAIYLEDSNFSVNVTELCWVNGLQGMTGVSTCEYNDLQTLLESFTGLWRKKKKRTGIRVQGRDGQLPALHRHKPHMGLYKALHTHQYICPATDCEGMIHYLPCKTDKTKVHRDRILSPLSSLLFCTASLVGIIH